MKESGGKLIKLQLWTGMLLSPIVWAVQLQAVYLLSEYGCLTGRFMPIHLVSSVAVLISLIGGFVAWSAWRTIGPEWPDASAGSVPRARFMALLGLLGCALFTLLIVAQWMPSIVGVPCNI